MMMKSNENYVALITGIGCGTLTALVTLSGAIALFFALLLLYTPRMTSPTANLGWALAAQETLSWLQDQQSNDKESEYSMATLYQQLNPGVVNIRVYGEREGFGSDRVGAGFILDSNGHIVTNYHVVGDTAQVTVVFYNEFEAEAKVIGVDEVSDLAVIKVDKLAAGTHPLLLGDSDKVAVGDWVLAIGNPLGQPSSLSVGIVSGVARTLPTRAPDFVIPGAIQTDADLNFGSSGGPLLNVHGEVIGLNTQIVTAPLGAGSGLGFAMPINLIQRVAPVLIEQGAYQWSWLGVQGEKVSPALRQANKLERQQGAYIDVVMPNSPAAKANLQGTSHTEPINGLVIPVGGDVVMTADGQPVGDFSDLLTHVTGKDPGDEIELTILRHGRPYRAMVKLELRPSNFVP